MSETLSYDLVDRLRSNIAILEHNFAALQAENGRLHNRVKELESSTFCVYCGKVSYTKEGQSKLDMMISHMAECDKHPAAGLLVEIERLKSDKWELVKACETFSKKYKQWISDYSKVVQKDRFHDDLIKLLSAVAKHKEG